MLMHAQRRLELTLPPASAAQLAAPLRPQRAPRQRERRTCGVLVACGAAESLAILARRGLAANGCAAALEVAAARRLAERMREACER